jgi:PII-like signaling protein
MVAIIDTAEKVERFLPVLRDMISEGLIAISDVEVIRYSHKQPAPGS